MVVNEQIRLVPGQKKNIKDFIQWNRYHIFLGLGPDLTRFPVVNASYYIKRYKHHESHIKNSKTITETEKPEDFTNKVK